MRRADLPGGDGGHDVGVEAVVVVDDVDLEAGAGQQQQSLHQGDHLLHLPPVLLALNIPTVGNECTRLYI